MQTDRVWRPDRGAASGGNRVVFIARDGILFSGRNITIFGEFLNPFFLIKNLNLEKKVNQSDLKYFMNWFIKLNKIEDRILKILH